MGKEEWIERASFVTVAGDDDDDNDLIFILNKSMNTEHIQQILLNWI